MPIDREPMTRRLDLALRWAAVWHDGQRRKASDVPYVQHPMAVAMVLDRLGYDEDVVIAGLLHDAVEDTGATIEDVRTRFGDRVAGLVGHCSEVKLDAQGNKRPWIDRKRDHLEALRSAPSEARAIVLADKLHNLISIATDLEGGGPVWDRFNAGRDQIIAMYRSSIEVLGGVAGGDGEGDGDPRLGELSRRGREVLSRVEGAPVRDASAGIARDPAPDDPAR